MYILTDYRLILIKDRPNLSSERALKNNKPQLSKENLKENEKLVVGLGWGPDTTTDWLTDCRP
jgi:hypothetical protein